MEEKEEVYIPGRTFKIDVDKIETLDDVKLILQYMNLHLTPPSRDFYDKTKHFLKY